MPSVGADGDPTPQQACHHPLGLLWQTIYQQIDDVYKSARGKADKITIHNKNLYHYTGAVGGKK